jgi:hypothetical protein
MKVPKYLILLLLIAGCGGTSNISDNTIFTPEELNSFHQDIENDLNREQSWDPLETTDQFQQTH